jgi:hypothetical protein
MTNIIAKQKSLPRAIAEQAFITWEDCRPPSVCRIWVGRSVAAYFTNGAPNMMYVMYKLEGIFTKRLASRPTLQQRVRRHQGLRNLGEPAVRVLALLLQPAEGFVFGQVQPPHEDPFCALDELAGFERLA